MAKAYEITEEISNEIRMIRKTIKNKSEDIRLYAVELRGLGKQYGTKGFRNFGKHHNDTYTAIYTRNEPHWTNLETNKTDGVRQ